MANQRFSGKLALITGASRGIGRAIALRLAGDGARIAAHGTKGAADTVKAIEAAGGSALSLEGNLATLAGVEALASSFRTKTGKPAPDFLINNAGIQKSGFDGIGRLVEKDFDELIAVNVKAPFFLVQKFVADIPAEGRIVNFSSRLSNVAFPDQIAYSMTKAAINSFTKSLAKELGPRSITVNTVGPGPIETDMTRDRLYHTAQAREATAQISALKKIAGPDEIADIVAFIVSHDARWITGAYFDATGGAGI